MKKENRALRKTVYAYQLVTKLTPNQLAQLDGGIDGFAVRLLRCFDRFTNTLQKCQFCHKIFQTDQFLESHILRRHPNEKIERPGTLAFIICYFN